MAEFFTLSEDTVVLSVPLPLRYLLTEIATNLAETLADPTAPGARRLQAPINPALDDDDVLARLDREMSTENDIATLLATIDAEAITITQANSWLRVLALAGALRASALGVVTSDDREALPDYYQAFLGLLSALQFQIITTLDPSIDPIVHPELYADFPEIYKDDAGDEDRGEDDDENGLGLE